MEEEPSAKKSRMDTEECASATAWTFEAILRPELTDPIPFIPFLALRVHNKTSIGPLLKVGWLAKVCTRRRPLYGMT